MWPAGGIKNTNGSLNPVTGETRPSGSALLAILPLFVYSYPNILTMITTANLYAAVAIPLGLQMLGTARVNFGPQLFLGIGGYTAALLNLHFGFESRH